MATASDIQHTRLKGETAFQNFCLKLVRRYWQDDYASAHGRRGQGQFGVDIKGRDNRNGFQHAAVQCKGTESDDPRVLSEKELVAEVEQAKGFVPKLDILIVAYCGKKDAALERKAEDLSSENAKEDLFRVVVWSWPDIVERALSFPELAQELLVNNRIPLAGSALKPGRPHGRADDVDSLVADLHSRISALVAPAGEPSEAAANAKLDLYREQTRAGNGIHVIQSLRNFIQEMDEQTGPRTRLRAYGNLAPALMQSGDQEGALIALDQAADADPQSAAGLAYKARAALARQNPTEAFALATAALKSDPANTQAALILVGCAPDEDATSTIETLVEKCLEDADVASELSQRYARIEKDHDAALRVARGIVPQSFYKDAIVAEAILMRFDGNVDLKVGAPIEQNDQFLIEEARIALERAWDEVKTRTDRSHWSFVGANLVAVLRLVGREDDADARAVEAHSTAPDDPDLIRRVIVTHMRRREIATAKDLVFALAGRGNPDDMELAASIAGEASDWGACLMWAQRTLAAERYRTSGGARVAELMVRATANLTSGAEAIRLATA